MPKDPPTKPETTPTKKRSTGVAAGQLFEKLRRLDAEEEQDLANAPAVIKRRYTERRGKLMADAGIEVADLATRMREGGE